MKKFFANTQSIVSEIQTLENDEKPRREDRAQVSAFYNGQPPFSAEEAEMLGLSSNVNNLLGYDEMSRAKGQLMALHDKPAQLFEVQVDFAPQGQAQHISMKATRALNRVIKRSGRFRVPYEGVAGDVTMHGEGDFFFPNTQDWCPQHLSLARRMIPNRAGIDTNDLTHFVIESDLQFADVMRYIKLNAPGWNVTNLNQLVKDTFQRDKFSNVTGDARTAVENVNPELMEYQRQASAELDSAFRMNIPVKYFIQMRPDKPGRPYDLTIIADWGSDKSEKNDHCVIFERECFYPSINRCLHPLFMNCVVGGDLMWHRILGLGHLNYSMSVEVEILMSRLNQAVKEGCTQYWEVADSASRETLERILMQHNGIIPEGVKMAVRSHGVDISGLGNALQLFRQQISRNSFQQAPNEGSKNDVLEVQAIAAMDQNNAARSAHVASWHQYFAVLGSEIFSRFTAKLPTNKDSIARYRGYSEIKDFQDEMQREGIPLHYLRPSNVCVTAAKIAGDGVRQKALAEAQFFKENMQMYSPEAQVKIKRRMTAAVTDDYTLAQELIPEVESKDSQQALRAETENVLMIERGNHGVELKLPINETDIHETHIPVHFMYLGALLQRAQQEQQSTFTKEQALSFRHIGRHAADHIRVVEEMGNKDLAKQFMTQLGEIAAMGDKMENNLVQQQPKEEDQQIDPVDKEKLVLESAKLELQQRKFESNAQFKERMMAAKEHQASLKQVMDLERDRREGESHKQNLATKDVETALKVTSSGKKE